MTVTHELAKLPPLDHLVERYRGLSESGWEQAFAAAMMRQASGLLECAALIRVKEDAGVDLEGLKERYREFFHLVRRFSTGDVVAELAAFWPDHPQLITLLGRLPKPDQLRAASGDSFDVIEMDREGGFSKYKRTAVRMTPEQRRRVFGGGFIRNEQEQRDLLTARRTRDLRRRPPEKVGGYLLDYDDPSATIGNRRVPLSVLDEIVRALKRFGYKQGG